MIDKINDIKKALEAGAYLSALALALTLPDICGKVAYPELSGNKNAKTRYIRWYNENIAKYDRRASCEFPVGEGEQKPCQNPNGPKSCDQSTDPRTCCYYRGNDKNFFTAEMCYQLRCAFLHSGNDNINEQGLLIDGFKLQITKSGLPHGFSGVSSFESSWPNNEIDKRRHEIRLDISQFCEWVYLSAQGFYEQKKDTLNFIDSHITVVDIEAEVERFDRLNHRWED